MIIFLSGPMTGLPNYNRDEFNRVAAALIKDNPNLIVLNPAILPDGMPWKHYITICTGMILVSDFVAALPGWETSKGSMKEKVYTEDHGKSWVVLKDLRPDLFDQPQAAVEK